MAKSKVRPRPWHDVAHLHVLMDIDKNNTTQSLKSMGLIGKFPFT